VSVIRVFPPSEDTHAISDIEALTLNIQSVQEVDDLSRLGRSFVWAGRILNETNLPHCLTDRISIPHTDSQLISIRIVIPVDIAPSQVFPFLGYLVAKSLVFPRAIRMCLLMRAVVLAGEAASLNGTNELQCRDREDGSFCQRPLL
jgi:hypothetical protein